jgi:hypothetical protein
VEDCEGSEMAEAMGRFVARVVQSELGPKSGSCYVHSRAVDTGEAASQPGGRHMHSSAVGVEVLLVSDSGRRGLVGFGAKIATGGPHIHGPAVDTETEEIKLPNCGRIGLPDSLVVFASGGRDIRSPGVDSEGEVQEHFHQPFSAVHIGSIRSESLGKDGEDSEFHTGRYLRSRGCSSCQRGQRGW